MARSLGAMFSPGLAGALLAAPILSGGLFFLAAGFMKLGYDGLLYLLFRRVQLPEESNG